MKNVCSHCGAVIENGSKICTNCGRMVSGADIQGKGQERQFSSFGGAQGNVPGAGNRARTTYAAQRSAKQMKAPTQNYGENAKRRQIDPGYDPVKQAAKQKVPFVTNETSGKEKNRSTVRPLLAALVKVALAAAVLYIAFAFVMVMLVRTAGYDFKLAEGVALPCDSYGEAFDNYFEDGKWRYSLKGNKVTFTGTDKDGKEYDITFGKKDGKTVVKRMLIDKKLISEDKIMDIYVMGMFMSEKT